MPEAAERIAEIIASQDMMAPTLLSALDDGALVSDVIVLVKYVNANGSVSMSMAYPNRQDWLVRRGMIDTALDLERICRHRAATADDD